MNDDRQFKIGQHRPVYMWAGSGTIRMNRLKFMGAPVDEVVHHEAHQAIGVRRMAVDAGLNWAYLMYDWGFPPEVEQEDWADFALAAQVYQAEGMHVFGYIQTSNCVYDGSYRQKDWYARDPKGRLIYYYTGRYMTCWLHPEWLEHLRQMTRGVIEAGAEGVFYDNPWHGGQPLHFGGAWMGAAGCFCEHCKSAFRAETGLEIPRQLNPASDATSQKYLRWRADLVARTIGELRDYARTLKPDVLVSVNDFDAVMRPSYLVYGIDLKAMAGVQDMLMIEDYGLPRWEEGKRNKPARLVNNALTLRTALALAGTTPLTTDPYDKGIGFDDVYPARRFVQGMAEAATCGVPMVVKGTEFVENGRFTLLTAERYAVQRAAIGEMNRWLGANASLYEDRQNLAEIGVVFPGVELWHDWSRLAQRYFGVGQALTYAGLPWRVVTEPQHMEGLSVLLTLGELPGGLKPSEGVRVVDVLKLKGWEMPQPPLLQRLPWLQKPVSAVIVEIFRGYFQWRLVRRLLDGLGMEKLFMQSPFYQLPLQEERQVLLSALGEYHWLNVHAKSPLLVEHWRKGGRTQVHLVNYADAAQPVTVSFGQVVSGQIISPNGDEQSFKGESVTINLDIYTVLVYGLPGD